MITYRPQHRVIARKLKDNSVIRDMSDDVISISTNKAYGRMAGVFRIVLTFREIDGLRYDEILATNDIITIELAAGDGSDMEYVLCGLIDRVARTCHYPDGRLHRTVTICGQDFGKLLRTQIGWDISGIRNLMEYGVGMGKIVSSYLPRVFNQRGTAAELVTWIFDIFKTQLPDAFYPQYVGLKTITDDSWLTYYPAMAGLKGVDAWSAMLSLANRPYNMLTTRTEKNGKFYVILEKFPADENGKLVRESYHPIDEEDVVSEDIGFSDHERVNLLCVWPTLYKTFMNNVLDIALSYPELTKISKDSIQTNGFMADIIEPNYVPLSFAIEEKEDPQNREDASDRADLFWAWNKDNHKYESGVFVVHGRPSVRPGDGLVHLSEDKQYLVEQVGHTYSVFPQPLFVSQLQVTRGQKN